MTVDKSNKYDRQLRLWAATGQSNLEESHICLVNATSTGSEILKNLILPGIGNFTIVDDKLVTENDLSGNFFMDSDSVEQLRAKVMCNMLMELNNDSKGHYVADSLSGIDDKFWDQFNIVIISDCTQYSSLSRVKNLLYYKGIPLIIVNTVGFYGSINIIANEVNVIETHASNKLFDLRIDKPWPELLQYSDNINLESLDDTDHAHIPYVIIFIKGLQKWRQDHNGQDPLNYREKKEFKKYIESMSRNINFETNFIEASNSVHRALQKTCIPNHLLHLFAHEKISDINFDGSLSFFWILVRALKNFTALKRDQLPLAGSLPDMASDTKNYINLQNLYKQKAQRDKELFITEVKNVIKQLNPQTNTFESEDDIITEEKLELINIFCKNCLYLHVTNGSSALSNVNLLNQVLESESSEFDDDEQHNTLGIYYGIMTFNIFKENYDRTPLINELDQMIDIFRHTFNTKQEIPQSLLNVFKEIIYHSTSSYHNLSSLIGGIAAQEILKLTTSQYVPLDNLLVFDGVRSLSEKWKIQ